MLFSFCWILVPRSTLSILPCSFKRLHSEMCLDSTVLNWFSSYLSCRSQQLLVRHSLSVETRLVCGVPQESVLGPLLFCLYTRQSAELIQQFCIDYHFFADDSELYSCLPTEGESALRAVGWSFGPLREGRRSRPSRVSQLWVK